jgi:hypothetical protein
MNARKEAMQRRQRVSSAWWRLVLAALIAAPVAVAASAASPDDEADAAAHLVRQTYYEGLPIDAARAIGPVGAARLVEMLHDPAERAHAANIAIALGVAAQPGAYEALAGALDAGASGEVDRPLFRLLDTVPLAMGYLARRDDRALAWLEERASSRGADPGWSHGPFRGQALVDQERRRAIAGLGLSGRSEAIAVLDAIAAAGAEAAGDPELGAAVASARDAIRAGVTQ